MVSVQRLQLLGHLLFMSALLPISYSANNTPVFPGWPPSPLPGHKWNQKANLTCWCRERARDPGSRTRLTAAEEIHVSRASFGGPVLRVPIWEMRAIPPTAGSVNLVRHRPPGAGCEAGAAESGPRAGPAGSHARKWGDEGEDLGGGGGVPRMPHLGPRCPGRGSGTAGSSRPRSWSLVARSAWRPASRR